LFQKKRFRRPERSEKPFFGAWAILEARHVKGVAAYFPSVIPEVKSSLRVSRLGVFTIRDPGSA
jgi:hypothetical protein